MGLADRAQEVIAFMCARRESDHHVVAFAQSPGIGRVETIKRQDGRWVVVTPKGVILSQR